MGSGTGEATRRSVISCDRIDSRPGRNHGLNGPRSVKSRTPRIWTARKAPRARSSPAPRTCTWCRSPWRSRANSNESRPTSIGSCSARERPDRARSPTPAGSSECTCGCSRRSGWSPDPSRGLRQGTSCRERAPGDPPSSRPRSAERGLSPLSAARPARSPRCTGNVETSRSKGRLPSAVTGNLVWGFLTSTVGTIPGLALTLSQVVCPTETAVEQNARVTGPLAGRRA